MLIELLRRAATRAPEQPAVIVAGREQSYAQTLARADAVAKGLRLQGVRRFGCALEDAADVLVVLTAAAGAGSEPCVYPRGLDAQGRRELAGRFAHDVVVAAAPAQDGEGVRVISLAQLEAVGAPASDGLAQAPDVADSPPQLLEPSASAPVLILTTGTTGAPKGARHDWRRLADAARPDARPGNRWLLAYNLSQFGGLQVLLHVLASRGTLVAAASSRPDDVITELRARRVTHASATPTFWRLLVGRLTAEPATSIALEQITLGGEASGDRLLAALRARFPSAAISQVYASTEFGSALAVKDGRAGLPLTVLDRDERAPVRFRIVDGELQARSRAGMLGYHESSDQRAEWRPTGDLVEVRGDRICFVGRKSEIINVGGSKVHPLPIEELVSGVPGVHMAAVYGRPNPLTGQIVALDVVPAAGAEPREVEAEIRVVCAALPAPAQPRRIRFVESLQLRGHKVIRSGTPPAPAIPSGTAR